jgi:hypothetical protein
MKLLPVVCFACVRRMSEHLAQLKQSHGHAQNAFRRLTNCDLNDHHQKLVGVGWIPHRQAQEITELRKA